MGIDKNLGTILQELTEKLGKVRGMGHSIQLEWGDVVNEREIASLEEKMGISLPPSFRQVAGSLGRSLFFSYTLSDFNMPDEFDEIYSGGISWDIDCMEFVSEITEVIPAEEDGEEQKEYIRQVSGMLRFADSGNGDIYAFDMAASGDEKPVLYWCHETGDVTYLAGSFRDYLERISRLYFVGDEIWQLELFLEETGINPDNEYGLRWRAWFETLLEPKPKAVKQDLKSLFALALTRKRLSDDLKKALLAFNKEDIFKMIQKKLFHTKGRDMQELLVTMITELIGEAAGEWVEGLWEDIEGSQEGSVSGSCLDTYAIPSDLMACLSARCLKEENAFRLVIDYLISQENSKVDGYAACAHLKYFDRRLVIPWMEQQNLKSPSGWDMLLMSVKPEWDDLQRWSEDSQRRKVLIDGLALLAEGEEELPLPSGLPGKELLAAWLVRMEKTELLNIRKRKLCGVLEDIDLFYEA